VDSVDGQSGESRVQRHGHRTDKGAAQGEVWGPTWRHAGEVGSRLVEIRSVDVVCVWDVIPWTCPTPFAEETANPTPHFHPVFAPHGLVSGEGEGGRDEVWVVSVGCVAYSSTPISTTPLLSDPTPHLPDALPPNGTAAAPCRVAMAPLSPQPQGVVVGRDGVLWLVVACTVIHLTLAAATCPNRTPQV